MRLSGSPLEPKVLSAQLYWMSMIEAMLAVTMIFFTLDARACASTRFVPVTVVYNLSYISSIRGLSGEESVKGWRTFSMTSLPTEGSIAEATCIKAFTSAE